MSYDGMTTKIMRTTRASVKMSRCVVAGAMSGVRWVANGMGSEVGSSLCDLVLVLYHRAFTSIIKLISAGSAFYPRISRSNRLAFSW